MQGFVSREGGLAAYFNQRELDKLDIEAAKLIAAWQGWLGLKS